MSFIATGTTRTCGSELGITHSLLRLCVHVSQILHAGTTFLQIGLADCAAFY